MDDQAMIDRALQAYFRRGSMMMQPSRACCEVKAIDGQYYVVLRNNCDTLAVYEVRGNPIWQYSLFGIKNPPQELLDRLG